MHAERNGITRRRDRYITERKNQKEETQPKKEKIEFDVWVTEGVTA